MSGDSAQAAASLLIPGLQAAATILILEYQKGLYDDIADDRIKLINEAVDNFVASVDAQIAAGAFDEAYGSVPEAILYEKVDGAEEAMKAFEDSLAGLPAGKRYVEAANRIMEQESITRLLVLDGRYLCQSELISCRISELLSGILPVGDVIEVVKDDAEQAAINSRIGNTNGTTLRDLGVSRLRAQREGQASHESHLASLNRDVSPINNTVSLREFSQTPAQRLALAQTEAQLIQASLQNQANAAAAGDPTAYGTLQAKLNEAVLVLGNEAQRGNMVNQFVPNYGAMLAPAIDSITEGLLGTGNNQSTAFAGFNVSGSSRDVAVDQSSGK